MAQLFELNLFTLFNISVEANDKDFESKFGKELKIGFQKKAMQYHPDKSSDESAKKNYNYIDKANQFLSHPLCRDYYIKNLASIDSLPFERKMDLFNQSLQYYNGSEKSAIDQASIHVENYRLSIRMTDESSWLDYANNTINNLKNKAIDERLKTHIIALINEHTQTILLRVNNTSSKSLAQKNTYDDWLNLQSLIKKARELGVAEKITDQSFPPELLVEVADNEKGLVKQMYLNRVSVHCDKILSAYEKVFNWLSSNSDSLNRDTETNLRKHFEGFLAENDNNNNYMYLDTAYTDLRLGTSSYNSVNNKPVDHTEQPVVPVVSELDAASLQCDAHIQQILRESTSVTHCFQRIQEAEQALSAIEGVGAEYKQRYFDRMNMFRSSLSDNILKATSAFKCSDIYQDKTTNCLSNLQLLCDKVESLDQKPLYDRLYPKELFVSEPPISDLDKSIRLLAYNGLLIDHQANIVNSYKEINQLLNQQGDCQDLINGKSNLLRNYSQQAYDESIKIRQSYNSSNTFNILLISDYKEPYRVAGSVYEMLKFDREQKKDELERIIPNLTEGIESLKRYIEQYDGKSILASHSNDVCYKQLEKIPENKQLCFAYLYLDALIKRQQELQDKYSEKYTPRADETKSEQIIKETEARQQAQQQAAREEAVRQQAQQQAAREEAVRQQAQQQAQQQAAHEEAVRQQAQQQAAREEAFRQQALQQAARKEAVRQQALQQAAREEAARQSNEAWNQEIALKNVRRQELILINNELADLKTEIDRLQNLGQPQIDIDKMQDIYQDLEGYNSNYLEGEWDKPTYVKEINALISHKSTLAVFSKHEGWAKPIAAILVNVLIAACGLLTFGISMVVSSHCAGSIFYYPKTPSQVILASLQDTINQLNDTVNDAQSSLYQK